MQLMKSIKEEKDDVKEKLVTVEEEELQACDQTLLTQTTTKILVIIRIGTRK